MKKYLIEKIKQELDEIKLTRRSAQSALLKEKEINYDYL